MSLPPSLTKAMRLVFMPPTFPRVVRLLNITERIEMSSLPQEGLIGPLSGQNTLPPQ